MTMPNPGFFVQNSALPVVPLATIARIHAQSGLSDACMGVCQVCCTQHFFRHGACRTEKGIGPWLVKSIQGALDKEQQLHQFGKETNIFFTNTSAMCVFIYLIFFRSSKFICSCAHCFYLLLMGVEYLHLLCSCICMLLASSVNFMNFSHQ